MEIKSDDEEKDEETKTEEQLDEEKNDEKKEVVEVGSVYVVLDLFFIF